MLAKREEMHLLDLLGMHEILRLRGFSFVLGPQGGVVVDRRGHVRGIWHFDGRRFAWTPASNGGPTHWADDAQAAVRYTLVSIAVT